MNFAKLKQIIDIAFSKFEQDHTDLLAEIYLYTQGESAKPISGSEIVYKFILLPELEEIAENINIKLSPISYRLEQDEIVYTITFSSESQPIAEAC